MARKKFIWCIFCFIVSISLGLTKVETKEPKIVILGAGAAGIAAATKLLDYGFKDLIILEAEPRIGGRVKTIPFADNVIDLGGQWCHGDENNPIYDMVRDLNLLDPSEGFAENATLVRTNGETLDKSTQDRLTSIIGELKVNTDNSKYKDDNEFNYFKIELEKALETAENKDIDKTIAWEFFETFGKGESSYESADSISELPVIYDPESENLRGNLYLNWKDKGYGHFLKILIKSEETGKEFGILEDHIKISKPVKRINWQRDDTKVLIECEDGDEILADHVIVTVSLGVLKAKEQEMFAPKLPAYKSKTIEAIEYGTTNKIFLEFEKPFWPQNWTGFSILWREQELQEIRGTDRAWLEGVFGIHIVYYQPRILEGWLVGSFGRHVETLPEEVVKNETLALLQRCLPWDLTPVLNFKTTDWFTNPHFRGIYSYYSMKTKAAGVKRVDLEKPLFVGKSENCMEENCERPVVLFAGEATNQKHSGLVHGAVETGWREAKRLADFYGKGV